MKLGLRDLTYLKLGFWDYITHPLTPPLCCFPTGEVDAFLGLVIKSQSIYNSERKYEKLLKNENFWYGLVS